MLYCKKCKEGEVNLKVYPIKGMIEEWHQNMEKINLRITKIIGSWESLESVSNTDCYLKNSINSFKIEHK
jgi:hypothetical protein